MTIEEYMNIDYRAYYWKKLSEFKYNDIRHAVIIEVDTSGESHGPYILKEGKNGNIYNQRGEQVNSIED